MFECACSDRVEPAAVRRGEEIYFRPDRGDGTGSALVFPDRFDVYYGMADNRIGLARLDLPEP